jgi:large subunit ribosomal protein L19
MTIPRLLASRRAEPNIQTHLGTTAVRVLEGSSMHAILDEINKSALKTDIPAFEPGDIIRVHFRIVEGDKARTQAFEGICISRGGHGINEMATVRKVVDEVGVERIFPVHSPMVAKYEMVRRSDARRAKLYYLRDRAGKSRRLRDRRRGLKHDPMAGVVAAPVVEAPKGEGDKK